MNCGKNWNKNWIIEIKLQWRKNWERRPENCDKTTQKFLQKQNFSDISNSIVCKLLNNSSTSIDIWNFDGFFQLFEDELINNFTEIY